MTLGNLRKFWVYWVAAALPFPLLLAGAWVYAGHLGERLGSLLAGWANVSTAGPPPATLSPDFDGGAVVGEPLRPAPAAPGVTRFEAPPRPAVRHRLNSQPVARSSHTPTTSAPPVPTRGIRVSAATVLRIANSGARPVGIPVPAEGARPAGLMLSGVSGLGVGMQDGDVLTHAGGRPALSEADVVGLVIAARGKEVPSIGGRFWRDGEPWNLVVEQPYVREDGTPLRRVKSLPGREGTRGVVVAREERGRSAPIERRPAADPHFRR